MEFKADFFTTWLNETAFQVTNLLYFEVLFGAAGAIGYGEDVWNRFELWVFMGTVYVVDGLMMMLLYENLMNVPQLINRGELDFHLLRPANTQFLISTRYVRPSNILPLTTGLILLGIGLYMTGATVTVTGVALYLLLVISGLVILYSTCFMFQTLAFWLLSSQGFSHGYFMFYQFIMKPDSVFRGSLRIFLTYVFPTVLMTSVPARVIIGKDLSHWLIIASLVAAAVSLIGSTYLFKLGLRRYESASS